MKKILLLLSLICSLVNGQILTNYQGQIISKNGKLMAAPEGIVFISNQGASLNQVTLTFRIDVGKSINIIWGDGNTTVATGTGVNQSYTSAYTGINSTYIVQLTGDLDFVRRFEINENTIKFNSTSQLERLSGLQEFYWNLVDFNAFNINILPSSLTYFYVNLSSSKGTLTGDLSQKVNLVTFDVQLQPNTLTGSITNLTNLNYLRVASGNTLSGSVTNLTNLTNLLVTGSGNTLSGSVTNLTNLIQLGVTGANTLSGSISNLTNLALLQVEGSNTLTGSILNLNNLVSLRVTGLNTLSGSVTGKTSLTQIYVAGSNTLTGSVETLTNLSILFITGSNTLTGSLTPLTNLTLLYATGSNTLSGSLSSMLNLGSIVITGSNALTNPLDLSALNKLISLQVQNSSLVTFISPASSVILQTTYLYSCNFDKFDFTNTLNLRGDLQIYNNPNDTSLILPATLTGDFTRIDAHGNALNQSSVDNLFKKLATYYQTHTPTANLYIDVSGGTNSAPTGGGNNADIIAIDAAFSGANKIFTLLTN